MRVAVSADDNNGLECVVSVCRVGRGAGCATGGRPAKSDRRGRGRESPITLVNPEITAAEGERVGLEGCLSLPDLVGEVRRAEWCGFCPSVKEGD